MTLERRGFQAGTHQMEDVEAESLSLAARADWTVDVPSDYPTVAAAIEDLEGEIVPEGVRVTINIESGHQLQEGYSFQYGKYHHLQITSEDATVSLPSGFSPVTVNGIDTIWGVMGTIGPLIDFVADGSNYTNTLLNGVYMSNAAHLAFTGNGGVINCNYGVDMYLCSSLVADSANLSGHANWGVGAWNSSLVMAASADLSGCNRGALVAHSSRADLQGANLSGASGTGLFLDVRGTADAFQATINNSGGAGVEAYTGAVCGLQGASVTGSANNDLAVNNGAWLAATGCTTSSSGGSQPDASDCNVRPNSLGSNGVITSGAYSENYVWQSGTTSNRPGSPSVGRRYFDEDLGQPIWYSGSDWIDATGTVV